TALTHEPLAQEAPVQHATPGAHAGQEPPQSTAASSPFCTPSEQVAGVQSPDAFRTRTPAVALPAVPSPSQFFAVARYQKRAPALGVSVRTPGPVLAIDTVLTRQESTEPVSSAASVAPVPR